MNQITIDYVSPIYNDEEEKIGENRYPVTIELCETNSPDFYYKYVKTGIDCRASLGMGYLLQKQVFDLPEVVEFTGGKPVSNHSSYTIDDIFYIHWRVVD